MKEEKILDKIIELKKKKSALDEKQQLLKKKQSAPLILVSQQTTEKFFKLTLKKFQKIKNDEKVESFLENFKKNFLKLTEESNEQYVADILPWLKEKENIKKEKGIYQKFLNHFLQTKELGKTEKEKIIDNFFRYDEFHEFLIFRKKNEKLYIFLEHSSTTHKFDNKHTTKKKSHAELSEDKIFKVLLKSFAKTFNSAEQNQMLYNTFVKKVCLNFFKEVGHFHINRFIGNYLRKKKGLTNKKEIKLKIGEITFKLSQVFVEYFMNLWNKVAEQNNNKAFCFNKTKKIFDVSNLTFYKKAIREREKKLAALQRSNPNITADKFSEIIPEVEKNKEKVIIKISPKLKKMFEKIKSSHFE